MPQSLGALVSLSRNNNPGIDSAKNGTKMDWRNGEEDGDCSFIRRAFVVTRLTHKTRRFYRADSDVRHCVLGAPQRGEEESTF